MTKNNIIIRFAVRDDVDMIMEAIKKHWDADHILAHNKDYFLYFFGENEFQINMVIGEEQNTKKIAGFLGFIRYSSNDCCDLTPILWKAINNTEAFLGTKLLLFLLKNVKHQVVFGPGANPKTAVPIYKMVLKSHIGQMDHYYRLSDRDEYKVAKITNKLILPIKDYSWNILLLPNFDIFKTNIDVSILNEVHPCKDINYFYHRFFMHPIYQYKIYAIKSGGTNTVPAFFVCREVEKFGVNILRIVDFIGEEKYFSYLAVPLQKLIDENNYEYIDCYCCGMSEKTMNGAGFIQRKEVDLNVIPNYFEPFSCENVSIYYHTTSTENFRSFKGDSDQDQPRINDRSLC